MPAVVRSPSRLPGAATARPSGALRVRRRLSHPLGSVPPSASFKVFQRTAPPSTSPPVSTPGAMQVALRLAFGRSLPATRTFRPRGLSPPRRLSPPTARGLVASHCRSWGSSGFHLTPPSQWWTERLPRRCRTLQSLPHPHSRTCISASRCPPAVSSCVLGHQGSSASRPCSARASVASNSRCRSSTPAALLGFPVSEAPHPSSRLAHGRPKPSVAPPGSPLGGSAAAHLSRPPACGGSEDHTARGRCPRR